MVGLVLVSHSHALAEAVQGLVVAMAGAELPVAVAAGAGDQHADLGTNGVEIVEAIRTVMSAEGVLVLMDIGSALLSTDTALGFLDDAERSRVRCAAAPFVEGAVAAGVVAALGSSLEEVSREAERALRQKQEHLGGEKVAPPEIADGKSNESASSVRMTVPNPHGLHARPAARFIREAAAFGAEIQVRNLTKKRGPVSAKSVTGLAALEILRGDQIEIVAAGKDAEAALRALRKAVESGLGDVVEALPVAPVAAVSSSGEPVAVSGGLVIGTLSFASTGQVAVPEHRIEDVEKELQRLHGAIEKARTALAAEQAALKSSAGTSEAEILAAQELILDDPELLRRAETGIGDRHENAAAAWAHAYQAAAAGYDELQDEYLRQRAADVRDIGARVLSALGVAWARVGDLAEPGILVVDDLTPAEVMALPATVRGVICLGGGRTSHAAILLRARGLPAIAQARRAFERAKIERPPGEITAAFDGDTGELWIDPESSRLQALRVQEEKRRVAAEEAVRLSHEPAVTADGQTIPIFANLGHAGEAPAALESGAEGVGLFRTEFLFLERATPPGEEEQFAALRQLGESMDTRPVTIRTLDVGGDKDLPYLGLAREANPFLGERGLRLCLQRPELFQAQLRAILRAGHGRDFRIMFPMVTELAELRAARAALDEAHQALAKSGTPHVWPISTGIMAEVPAAAILSDQLAAEADFFSIGTNDLTQYVLAADRAHSTLAHFQDALHPAVLRVIAQITAAARAHGRHVGVCGEAASDPAAAGLFVGLGVDDLSLGVGQLPMVKAVLRAVRRSDLETLAARALEMASAGEVRAMVRKRASLDKTAMKSPP